MQVIVVGAGIVGVTTALTLAEQGVEVVVLERGSVAGQASGLNAGVIGGGGWGDRPDIDVALKMGSREQYIELSTRRGHDIGLDLTGTLTMIRTEDEWVWAASLVEASRASGRQLELLDASELIDLEPAADPELLGAILDPLGARAEPVAATTAFAAEAVSAGAVVETDCAVSAIRPVAGGGWEVERQGRPGLLGADAVVLAAGPWCAELGAMVGVDIPIVAVRGQMWASEPQPPMLRHAIAAAESLLAWSVKAQPGQSPSGRVPVDRSPPELTHRRDRRVTRHLYGRQRPGGEIVFGGDRVLSTDRTVDLEGIAVNHDHVAELLPAVGGLAPCRTWTGLMPFSLDGRPLLGPVPGHDGLFLAGGLASSGFGRGPMAGRLVADLILERNSDHDASTVLPGDRVTAVGRLP